MPRIEPSMKTTSIKNMFILVVRLAGTFGIVGILTIPLRPDTRT
jgi:hypothetical protein